MKKQLIPLLILVFLVGCNLPKAHTPTAEIQYTRIVETPHANATLTPTLELPTETPLAPTAETRVTVTGTRTYDLVFEVRLINNGGGKADRIRLVVALISDREPFQRVLSMNVSHPYTMETDEYDNQFATLEFTDFNSGEEVTVTFEYRVEVDALVFNLGDCTGEMTGYDLYQEEYIESNAQEIIDTAQALAKGKRNACEIARAYYDYVGDNMDYAGYNPGEVGALQALQTFEGDCTEFSDLTTALLRAEGIPARPVEGLTCCTTSEEYSAGNIKHNWLLVSLPGIEWAPLDPTWGRFDNQREAFFAAIDDQHIILTLGRSPMAMNGYHGFTYTWWGSDVAIDNEESWSMLEVVP